MRFLPAFLAICSLVAATTSKPNVKTGGNGLVKLNDASFSELTKTPREFHAVILLTALGTQFNCVFCKEFDPEYTILANSWQKAAGRRPTKSVYFGHLDFENGKETFRSLQLVSAPNLWIFPPTIDENGQTISGEPIRYDFTNSPTADAAAAFISKSIGQDFKVVRPFDYLKFAKFTMSIGSFGIFLFFLYKVAGFIFLSKHFWAVISLLLILVFNGGYMYTQIRGSPYSRGDGYIAGGFQDQYGAETQIVAATCKSNTTTQRPKLIRFQMACSLSQSSPSQYLCLVSRIHRLRRCSSQYGSSYRYLSSVSSCNCSGRRTEVILSSFYCKRGYTTRVFLDQFYSPWCSSSDLTTTTLASSD